MLGMTLLGLFAAYVYWISAPEAYDESIINGGSGSMFAIVVALCLVPGCGVLCIAGRHYPAASLILFMAGFAILVTRAMQLLPLVSGFQVEYAADLARLDYLRRTFTVMVAGSVTLMAFALVYLFSGKKIERK